MGIVLLILQVLLSIAIFVLACKFHSLADSILRIWKRLDYMDNSISGIHSKVMEIHRDVKDIKMMLKTYTAVSKQMYVYQINEYLDYIADCINTFIEDEEYEMASNELNHMRNTITWFRKNVDPSYQPPDYDFPGLTS